MLVIAAIASIVVSSPVFADESGVFADKIVIGTTHAVTGTGAGGTPGILANSRDFLEGSLARFHAVNAAGGINGKKIELLVLDDSYDQRKANENVARLIDTDKVFGLYGVMGSKILAAITLFLEKVEAVVSLMGQAAVA